jgi:hypothetical protein
MLTRAPGEVEGEEDPRSRVVGRRDFFLNLVYQFMI